MLTRCLSKRESHWGLRYPQQTQQEACRELERARESWNRSMKTWETRADGTSSFELICNSAALQLIKQLGLLIRMAQHQSPHRDILSVFLSTILDTRKRFRLKQPSAWVASVNEWWNPAAASNTAHKGLWHTFRSSEATSYFLSTEKKNPKAV